MRLSDLSLQSIAYVQRLADTCPDLFKRKLLAMGFVRGSHVTLIRKAPLGCPLEVDISGTRLTLRKSEAECIFVTEVQGG